MDLFRNRKDSELENRNNMIIQWFGIHLNDITQADWAYATWSWCAKPTEMAIGLLKIHAC